MMLGGSSRKDPGAPILKKVSLAGGDGKHVFIPVNTKAASPMIAMPGPQSSKGTNGSQRLVMVRGPTPNMGAPLKGQSILVPVNAAPGGKIVSTGGQTVGSPVIIGAGNKMPIMGGNFIKTMKGGQVITRGQLPKTVFPGNVISSTDSNKPVLVMQSPQSTTPGAGQRILVPAPKGSKGGPFMMVPVSSSGSQPILKTQQSLKPGVSLMPVSMGSSPQGGQKVSIAGQQFIRIPHPGVSSNKNMMQGKNSPVFVQSMQGGMKQIRMPSGMPANAKTVFVPDSALGSIPKGVQLIPISGLQSQGQKSAIQVSSSNLGALQGGKVIYVQNTPGAGGGKVVNYSQLQRPITTSGKQIVVVGGPGGKPVYSKSGHNVAKTVLRTVNTGSSNITYRNMGASHLPSMLNKPIKPKPVIETSDTFFKTPIEIKPLEEENDDDLDDVLNALQGNGHVDLVPVNTASTHTAPPTPVTPQVEDFGLRIDSVYSLSSDTGGISWDEKPREEPSEEQSTTVTDNASKDKADSEKDDKKDTEQDSQVDTNGRHLTEVSTLSTEPLLPEDEPSQSGQPTSSQSEKTLQEETDMDIEDPNDDVGNKIEEDPNLMRGDCLQVRLAQQAAGQLQEQMRQESERRSLVQAEWDEDMANQRNNSGEKSANNSDDEQDDKECSSEEEMEVGSECERSSSTSLEKASETDARKDREAEVERGNVIDDLEDTEAKDEQEASTSEKQSDNDSKKTEAGDDVAKKALLAATLHGCEVADDDLNDMFDELISEYLTTPERPKPSVRVRGIDECKAFMEDSPQSLVTTTQQSSPQHLNTSLLPRSIPQMAMQQAMQPDSRMQPRQLKTAAGTITLIPVKVPVPGKPGETTIKYIPMQLPAGASGKGASGKPNAPMPQFVKIMPSTSKTGQTSQTVALSGATGGSPKFGSPKFVKIVTSATPTKTTPQAITSVSTASGHSLLKMVMPTTSTSSTTVKPSSSTNDGGLSNEDMAKAIVGATRNVLGKSPVPAKPNIVYVQRPGTGIMKGPLMSKMPVFFSGKAGKMAERIIIHPKTAGPSDQSTFTASSISQNLMTQTVSEVPKKKKKKKKRLKKWPKTKKCSVRLRKLNMKVIRNSSVNLKRVKKGFLFEAIARQPRREAKRKATEMEQSPEQPAAKRAKDDDGQALPMPVPSSTSLMSVLNMPSASMAVAGSKVHSLLTSSGILTVPSSKGTAAMSGAPTLYRIMSQLPSIRPAVSGAPRPTPSQILNPSTLKMQSLVSTESMKNPVFSLLSKSAAALGLPNPSGSKTVTSSPSSAITLTLSCTTASSLSTAIMSPQSVCTSSKASTILTTTCSAPVLSPSVAGKSSVMSPPSKSPSSNSRMSPPNKSQSSNSQGIQKTPEMPKMPTLLPAGARTAGPGQSSVRIPMPALHPAPRSLIVRAPGPALQSPPRPPLPVIRPRPPVAEPRMPVIIQPTEPGVTAAGASSQGGLPNAPPNKKYLLIKTSAGQFLVPVPVSKQGGASGAAGPTSTTTVAPSTGSPVQLQVNVPRGGQSLQPAASRAPTVAATPAVTVSSRDAVNNLSPRTSAAHTSNILGPIAIKDEPKDTGYDKYEKPPVEEPSKTAIKEEEKGSDDEGDKEPQAPPDEADEEPPVAASVCHKQRIEELKARLREHEEQLLELKRKREDTKKILESLDNEQSD